MLSELLRALKSWKNARAIAVLAILALAVGIGSATAIYTVVNTILLSPLPYPEGDRFVALYSARFNEPEQRGSNAAADLVEYQQRTGSFDAFGWFRLGDATLTSPGAPQHIDTLSVTTSLVHNLGVRPLVGQWFTDETGAVISYALWQRLGGEHSIVGGGLTLDGRRLTVTGVMPPTFRLPLTGPGTFGVTTDVWLYLDPRPREGNEWVYFAYARRRPGVTLAQAEADVKRVAAEIAASNPVSHPAYTARLDDLKDSAVETIRPTLLLLFASAALLLLIACANVAALLLARSVMRARETATRVAMGASQLQLAFYYFIESLVISMAGAALGGVVSVVLVRLVIAIASAEMPRAEEMSVDWTVFAFAAAAALVASTLSSLAPLWQALRMAPNEVLNAGVRASAGARARTLLQSLVVAEIVLAFTLLAVSALLIAQMRGLLRTSPGFVAEQLLTFQLALPAAIAGDDDKRTPFQKRLVDAMQSIPGVSDASFANQLPLDGCCLGGTIYPDGRSADAPVERVAFVIADAGYVRAMGIPLRAGRLPSEADIHEEVLGVAINQEAARRFWPDKNPLETLGRINDPREGQRFRVVGVVGDVRNNGLANPPVSELYIPSTITTVNPMNVVVRSVLPASTLIPELRRAIERVDPELPIHGTRTMAEIIADSLVLQRISSFVVTFFALAALMMATLGVYGLVSYGVRQRRTEIGTRLAIGAVQQDVVRLVLGSGLRMAVLGVAFGSIAVLAATGLLVRFLEIRDLSFLPFALSTVIVVSVVAIASSFPAWRAARVSPMVAIREEDASVWDETRRGIGHVLKELSAGDEGERRFVSEGVLLAEFAAAARDADSFTDVLRGAIDTLRSRVGAQSAMLLQKTADGNYRCSTAAPERDVDVVIPAGGYLLQRLGASTYPLPLAADDITALLRWSAAHKPERTTELMTLERVAVRLSVALRSRAEIIGIVLLGPPESRQAYGEPEKRLLHASASQFALMIENARLTDRVVEQENVRRDLALAAEVQRRLLPEHPPADGMASIAAVSLPARTVGGDYYDFIEIGGNQIGIALADVAGKGVAAALIMSVVQASLRIISSEGDISLPMLAAKMNRFLHRSTASNSYATFFYAQIDEEHRQLRYVNAGHNPPYLLRSGSEIEELSTGGAVIGLFPQLDYEEGKVDLRSGDVLVAFTDGVTEALNASEEEFGNDRLKDLLRRVVHLPVEEISTAISAELKNWIRDAAQYDDLTFVVVKVK